jgi:hypothetical protein
MFYVGIVGGGGVRKVDDTKEVFRSRSGTAYPSGTLKFILVFSGARVGQSSVFLALTIDLLNIVFRLFFFFKLSVLR